MYHSRPHVQRHLVRSAPDDGQAIGRATGRRSTARRAVRSGGSKRRSSANDGRTMPPPAAAAAEERPRAREETQTGDTADHAREKRHRQERHSTDRERERAARRETRTTEKPNAPTLRSGDIDRRGTVRAVTGARRTGRNSPTAVAGSVRIFRTLAAWIFGPAESNIRRWTRCRSPWCIVSACAPWRLERGAQKREVHKTPPAERAAEPLGASSFAVTI